MSLSRTLILGAAALLALAPAAPLETGRASAASFDCARAASPTEIAICADPALSALDAQMGAAYAARLAHDPAVRPIQRAWLKARDEGCGKEASCLKHMIRAQVVWLRSGGPMPGRLPRQEGLCSLTTVSELGSRLEGEPGSGSAVREANGAFQVSYETIPAIEASRVGDRALVCLTRIPTDCPPGDTRGRDYAVTNLRTMGAWDAPDAQHICGGA